MDLSSDITTGGDGFAVALKQCPPGPDPYTTP